MSERSEALGVILSGGQNRRFGSHKALARVGGHRIIDRVGDALRDAVDRVVVVANDLATYAEIETDVRPDVRPGLGALGGVYTAVRWAEGEGYAVALTVACDMPFLPPALLARLVDEADRNAVTAAASEGPRGVEPLCAVYGIGCRGAIEAALARGERAVVSFYPAIRVVVLDAQQVARYGDPATMFMNVNRPEDRRLAESLLAGSASKGTTS